MHWLQSTLIHQADRVLALYQSQQAADAALIALQGKTLAIHLNDLQLQLTFKVAERICFIPSSQRDWYDCSIRCASSLLPKLRDTSMLPSLIQSGELQLEGNIQVASRIADALNHIQFDSEEWLSQYLGDVPAHLFCKGLRALHRWALYRAEQTKLDVMEWLQDEIRLLPLAPEQSVRSQQIQQLSSVTQQLSQRIEALTTSIPTKVSHEPD